MRTEKDIRRPEIIEADDEIRSVDYKASPHEVLEAVDRLLAAEHLEIVMLDTGGDEYAFTLKYRREAGTRNRPRSYQRIMLDESDFE